MNAEGNRFAPAHLDEMLTTSECAAWLRLHPRVLIRKTKGRYPVVPAVKLGVKEYRFHPRTILAKFASEGGISVEMVAASLGLIVNRGPQ